MQLVDSAQLQLRAYSYADDIKRGINTFLGYYAKTLDNSLVKGDNIVEDLQVKT